MILSDPKTGKKLEIIPASEYQFAGNQKQKSDGCKYVYVTRYKFRLADWENRVFESILCTAKTIGYTTYKFTIWGITED